MAIEKFKFVSPGVQVQEIDDSRLPAEASAVGPVVIGRTVRGPAMQPVQVSSIQQLEAVFGAPSNGATVGADVWRNGGNQAPTFATYAAKAYLQNSGPVTVVRLLGVNAVTSATGNQKAGWSITQVTGNAAATANAGAFGLFVSSGSSATGTLAAIIYTSGSTPYISHSSGFTTASAASIGTNLVLKLSGSSDVGYEVNFDPTSSKFIRAALNTDSTRLDTVKYFLGETFEKGINAVINGTITSASVVPLSSSYSDYKSENTAAKSGWIVSQDTGLSSGFTASATDGTYPVKKLFRLVALNGGNWDASGVKISIENIKAATQPAIYPYGSFDVVVRSLIETAGNNVIERFNGCTLDQNAPNFIGKVIGTAYRAWNTVTGKLEEHGEYPNNSSIFRVEMSSDTDISSNHLPFGFYGPEGWISTSDVNTKVALTSSIGYQVVEMPKISLLTSTLSAGEAKTKRYGLVSTASQTDLVDLLRYGNATDSGKYSLMFSLHDISGSDTVGYTYNPGSYKSGNSVASPNTKVLGFDVPVYGGFDGLDITKKEPLINQSILSNTDQSTSHYAYATIKRAIDMVADPESVQMDVLAVPGVKNKFLTQYMVDVCKQRGDALAIIDLEGDLQQSFEGGATTGTISPVATVVNNLNDRAIDNSYGAAYFPAVFVGSEGIYMPASIAALGAFGGTRGRSAVWFAPAGFNRGGLTQLNSGIGVTRTRVHLNSSDRDALYAANINPIAQFPSEGVVIFGQKTLQTTPSALDRVNVRRLVNFIKKNISTAATAVLFEPNVEDTWNNFKSVVNPFLESIIVNYGLDDARVVLDSRTTTADLVDRNIMYAKILLKPTRAIEFIALDFVISNSGAIFTE
jgi:hypothetical protein